MMEWYIVFIILAAHWVCDFVLQTHWQAINKSKSLKALLSHTSIYSMSISILMIILLNYNILYIMQFFFITFVCHTITDYYTSRLNAKLWLKGDIHNFFVSVGFDQLLHYLQLFLTYLYIIKN